MPDLLHGVGLEVVPKRTKNATCGRYRNAASTRISPATRGPTRRTRPSESRRRTSNPSAANAGRKWFSS